MSNDQGAAFVKGGGGCLLAFLVIGLIFVLLGGSMYINLGGVILLFVIGGIIGLVILAVYSKGQSDAANRELTFREQGNSPHQPVRSDGAVGGTGINCPNCGSRVNPATGEGLHCPVGQPWVLICDRCQNKIDPAS
jgi:hypothetical protein